MKKIIKLASFTVLVLGLALSSCKKKDTKVEEPVPAPEQDESSVFAEHSSDMSSSDNGSDMAMDDAEYALDPSSLGGARSAAAYPSICNATVDTSAITSLKKITINYNGNSCDGLRSRTGAVVIQLVSGTKWRNMGSVLSVTYSNFKITKLANGKSIIINGTHFITNVTGGLVVHIGISPNPSTIVRKIRSYNMSITFDDNTVRSWMVARTRTWTGSSGIAASLTIAGDTTINSNANTEVWGTNRAGKAFTTVATNPIVVTSACGWYAPVSGKKTHNINGRISTVTFGTDATGAVAVPSSCPNHYLVAWTSPLNVAKSYIGMY